MSEPYEMLRRRMVTGQLAGNGIYDPRVLAAMRDIPRHLFVPEKYQRLAYTDQPLRIGEGQTISQPYVVALMTQMLRLTGTENVLEIGTGSGYQTAILCRLARRVYSLEYYPRLAGRAARVLEQLGCENLDIHVGDGSQGLADMAPFDAIIVTAAAPSLPGPLRSQLSPAGGRLVIPVGSRQNQVLMRVIRQDNNWNIEQATRVRFVLMGGRYGFHTSSSTVQRDDDELAGV